ncbi:serine dehydratase beta chain [Bradyrhizobium sp. RDI18]|uniref:serine dehydratase beta chain n=1 Tax=Bradyrhizobium sp. RDI18 TaxID=3367400 RepID=UPI00371B3BBF
MPSVFEAFRIGIGPLQARNGRADERCQQFRREFRTANLMHLVERVVIDLYGSLALTGIGHAPICRHRGC